MTDYKAAIATGVSFVGILNDATKFPIGTLTIKDFKDPILLRLVMN